MSLKVFQFWARGPPASQENGQTCGACKLCCLNAHASGVCFVIGICCVVWPILEGHENDVSGEVGGYQHLKVCDPCARSICLRPAKAELCVLYLPWLGTPGEAAASKIKYLHTSKSCLKILIYQVGASYTPK